MTGLNDTPYPGDLDDDVQVGLGDLAILLSSFGVQSGAEFDDGSDLHRPDLRSDSEFCIRQPAGAT